MGGTLCAAGVGGGLGLSPGVAAWGWRFRWRSSKSLWFVVSRFDMAACWNPALSRCPCDKDALKSSWVPGWGTWVRWVP